MKKAPNQPSPDFRGLCVSLRDNSGEIGHERVPLLILADQGFAGTA